MSEQISGVVVKLGTIKSGRHTFYNIQLDGHKDFYRTGFEKAEVEVGDVVTFEYGETDYGPKVDMKSIKVTGKEEVKASPAPKKGKGKSKQETNYWESRAKADEKRQNTISYQAAWNTATAIISLAVQNDTDPSKLLTTLTGKTDKKKVGNLVAHIEGVAQEIFEKFLHGDELAQELLEPDNQAGEPVSHNKEEDDLDD